jgi:PAS domain S-box-containing protein
MVTEPPESQREAYYRALVENTADPIALLSGDGTILFVTESIARVTGYSRLDLIGRNPLDLVHPEDLPRVRQALHHCLQRPGNRVSVEYRARHRNGAWHHHEVIGVNRLNDFTLRAIIVTQRDITARKHAEAALIESVRGYASTFDEAPIGIAHTTREGNFLRVNRRLTELLGYWTDELMALTVMAITHPDDVEDDRRATARLLGGGLRIYERRTRYRHKAGHILSIRVTTVLHRDATGAAQYLISYADDAVIEKPFLPDALPRKIRDFFDKG